MNFEVFEEQINKLTTENHLSYVQNLLDKQKARILNLRYSGIKRRKALEYLRNKCSLKVATGMVGANMLEELIKEGSVYIEGDIVRIT